MSSPDATFIGYKKELDMAIEVNEIITSSLKRDGYLSTADILRRCLVYCNTKEECILAGYCASEIIAHKRAHGNLQLVSGSEIIEKDDMYIIRERGK